MATNFYGKQYEDRWWELRVEIGEHAYVAGRFPSHFKARRMAVASAALYPLLRFHVVACILEQVELATWFKDNEDWEHE